jgi:hypothetical protein
MELKAATMVSSPREQLIHLVEDLVEATEFLRNGPISLHGGGAWLTLASLS